jgi:hypothetical protein
VLTAKYEGDTPVKQMNLHHHLYHLEHDPSEPIIIFLTTFRTITSELASIGHPLKADEIRDVVLMNLHASFEVITTLLTSQDKNGSVDWTTDLLGTQLSLFKESRYITNPSGTMSEAAHAAHGGRPYHHSTPCHHCQSSSSENWPNCQNLPNVCA